MRVLSAGDVEVVPVVDSVDPESAGQLARFEDSGLAVVNRIPPAARPESSGGSDVLASHLKVFNGVVVKIPELPVVRSPRCWVSPCTCAVAVVTTHVKGFLKIIESLFGDSDV